MKRLESLGIHINKECQVCGIKKTRQKLYSLRPQPAIVKLLIDQEPKIVCKKCVKRALGKKHIKELNELEESS